MKPSSDPSDRLERQLRARRRRHRARHQERLLAFLEKYHSFFRDETDLVVRRFSSDQLLARHLLPIADSLRSYLEWLRWSGWLSAHLAPPLGLESDRDGQRLAVAVLTYLGARLVDDSLDHHLNYKKNQLSFLGALYQDFPEHPENLKRGTSALIGFWLLNYGLRRLRQLGMEPCADRTAKLFSMIPPGVVAEAFHQEEVTEKEYRRIIQRKAVAYDMIIYQNLLHPVAGQQREQLLSSAALASEIAQLLNDRADYEDDEKRRQLNAISNRFHTAESLWSDSLLRVTNHLEQLDRQLEQSLTDAVAAIFVEVFEASVRRWGELGEEPWGGT